MPLNTTTPDNETSIENNQSKFLLPTPLIPNKIGTKKWSIDHIEFEASKSSTLKVSPWLNQDIQEELGGITVYGKFPT